MSVYPAMGRDACVVRSSLSRQREERRHYGQPVGHRDSEGDWYQQPSAQAQAPPRHPGNGLPHQSFCACQHSLRKAWLKKTIRLKCEGTLTNLCYLLSAITVNQQYLDDTR